MEYVDGFVATVPTRNEDEYIRHAVEAARLFKEHGATRLVECRGHDMSLGQKTLFLPAVKCHNETVVFS